ncbi:MAG: DUF2264 domain-containing protein [Lachnospiraceae bacterium]
MRLHTKQEFRDWMNMVLEPLKPLYSEGKARLHLGDTGVVYPQESIELEAFSRPLWALVPFWMGGGSGWEEIYQEGLVHGTDPEHEEYWGGFQDYDQRFVEMAAIACGLIFVPEVMWDPLDEKEKRNLAEWLYGINEYTIPVCNWQFFMILVNVGLKKCGQRYSSERLAEGLELVEDFYLGDGWYRDGASAQKDYYISFAMHYYGLLYSAALQGDVQEEERCSAFRRRAELFAQDFLYWFDEDGAALPYGRSLAYRFGQGAFWAAYVFAGLDGIPVGVVKGILERHLNWWTKQKIFDRDGILTIGYGYPNLTMAERYNAPGSPYWGMKTLLCLGLPDYHPFWTAQAQPLPERHAVKPLFKADMLMHHRNRDVIAYPAGVCEMYGHGHVPEKYAKFAYSTKFGFSVAHSQIVLHENAPDSMLAFVIDGDDYVFVRKVSLDHQILSDRVISTWSPFPGIKVTTTIIPDKEGHSRIHEIESSYDCIAYDCGFAVEKFTGAFCSELKSDGAYADSGRMACRVTGSGAEASGYLIEADPNTNLLYPNTVIPAVSYRIKKGTYYVLKTYIATS